MRAVPSILMARVLARSLLIQGSWNYRTMIGTGMAFTLLPLLTYLHRGRGTLDEALELHAGHFNAHPYLAGLALGSLVRLEEDGAPPDTIRRFRTAVAGPLGALGDRVVWATWLPLCSLLALIALESGMAAWGAVLLFLGIYNVGHLALRVWGFRTGYRQGARLATALRSSRLSARSHAVGQGLIVLAGVLAGLLLTGDGLPIAGLVGGIFALGAGWWLGLRLWRPTALLVVAAVVLLLIPELVP